MMMTRKVAKRQSRPPLAAKYNGGCPARPRRGYTPRIPAPRSLQLHSANARLGRQEAVDEVRPRDRLRLGGVSTFEVRIRRCAGSHPPMAVLARRSLVCCQRSANARPTKRPTKKASKKIKTLIYRLKIEPKNRFDSPWERHKIKCLIGRGRGRRISVK